MAMTDKEKKQAQILGIVLAVAAVGLFWVYWRTPKVEAATVIRAEMDTLRAQTDTIRTQLREGTAEDIETRIATYSQSLALMRQLVPSRNEVTTLVDDITSRARRRGVTTADYRPAEPTDDGSGYLVYNYGFTVIGTYDAIGAFLSDVASLPRIMVPREVSLELPENQQLPPELAADSSTTYVVGRLSVRTWAKQPETMEDASGL
jgi:type IV pilus assembly protein PilO